MLHAILVLSVVFYLAMTHITYRYTRRIKQSWFGDNYNNRSDVFLSFFWPFSLPAFHWAFYKVIKSVRIGEDWADVNMKASMREDFRNKYMRKKIA